MVLNAWNKRKYEKKFMQFAKMKTLADMKQEASSPVPAQGTAAGVSAINDFDSASAAPSGIFAITPIDDAAPAMQYQPDQTSNQQGEHAAAITLKVGSTSHHFGKEIVPSNLENSFQDINLKNSTPFKKLLGQTTYIILNQNFPTDDLSKLSSIPCAYL